MVKSRFCFVKPACKRLEKPVTTRNNDISATDRGVWVEIHKALNNKFVHNLIPNKYCDITWTYSLSMPVAPV
jgi:hypothetical protein